MRRLHRYCRQRTGAVSPNMFPSLTMRQVAIRIGEVSLIAGQPASDTLAMAMAVQVPTLYLSADTHAHTASLRLLVLTGTEQSVSWAMIGPCVGPEMLKQADYIRWSFDSAPIVRSRQITGTASCARGPRVTGRGQPHGRGHRQRRVQWHVR